MTASVLKQDSYAQKGKIGRFLLRQVVFCHNKERTPSCVFRSHLI